MKLQTEVVVGRSAVQFGYEDKILVFGSCFADTVGARLGRYGFNSLLNPFGTLYNPISIAKSVFRLQSGEAFTQEDCVQMGANLPYYCSFSHHTSFARQTTEEFLRNANESLKYAAGFFAECNTVFITLGTSFYYALASSGEVVSNCLRRPSQDFNRKFLSLEECIEVLDGVVSAFPDKRFIFTVSPVRHFSDGAHANQLSKSSLLLSVSRIADNYPDRVAYFPAYEIVMDELRDYRFYAEDMLHPSTQTQEYIWERFCDFALLEGEKEKLLAKKKLYLKGSHKPLLHRDL